VAYNFFQPSDKQLLSKDNYVKKQNADASPTVISDIQIVSVVVNGDTATVRISI